MEQRRHNKLLLTIKQYIEAKFTRSDWEELAYLTNGYEIIQEHRRLLQSLSFGDDDYAANVLEVLVNLLHKDPANLQIIIEHIDLPAWLNENNPKVYEELYGGSGLQLDTVETKALSNSFDLNQYIGRIRRTIESDPELAVGSTKEMLESVLKSILEAKGEILGKEDLPQLLKRVQKVLNLDPSEVDVNAKGSDIVKRTLSNLGQVVIGIDELRNLYGTGHGRTRRSGITPRHARLVVSSGAALAVFLMDTFEFYEDHQVSRDAE